MGSVEESINVVMQKLSVAEDFEEEKLVFQVRATSKAVSRVFNFLFLKILI